MTYSTHAQLRHSQLTTTTSFCAHLSTEWLSSGSSMILFSLYPIHIFILFLIKCFADYSFLLALLQVLWQNFLLPHSSPPPSPPPEGFTLLFSRALSWDLSIIIFSIEILIQSSDFCYNLYADNFQINLFSTFSPYHLRSLTLMFARRPSVCLHLTCLSELANTLQNQS